MTSSISPIERTDAVLGDLIRKADGLGAQELVERSFGCFGSSLVMTTSFGSHSAVMLHLVTRVIPDIPVIWIDTGYLFPETYRFAEELSERLSLNLKVYQSSLSPARMEALHGRLWESNRKEVLDRYDLFRKVEPMQRALQQLGARGWLAGLRAEQTQYRKTLPRIHRSGDYYKILPILQWSAADIDRYLREHALPYHPLFDRGYVSIGDWHSSRPRRISDSSDRDTRYRGVKQECGLHFDLSAEAAESLDSSKL